uniref:Uncharacterized protein n=1 Tax=Anopheles culicifacies TaxID=139723 RepID=A0A182M852_9DIPT
MALPSYSPYMGNVKLEIKINSRLSQFLYQAGSERSLAQTHFPFGTLRHGQVGQLEPHRVALSLTLTNAFLTSVAFALCSSHLFPLAARGGVFFSLIVARIPFSSIVFTVCSLSPLSSVVLDSDDG